MADDDANTVDWTESLNNAHEASDFLETLADRARSDAPDGPWWMALGTMLGEGWRVIPPDMSFLTTGDEIVLRLPRNSVEALLFHYTKNGIPESQVGARELARLLAEALGKEPDGQPT